MIRKYIIFPLFVIILFSIYVNYSTYKSLIIQSTVLKEYRSPKVYTFDILDSVLPSIPNITITAMPLDVFKANYLLSEGRLDEVEKYIERAKKINPHTYVGDFLDGKLLYYRGSYDSAFVSSKRAFYGWPKNIDHYNSYVDVLEKLSDTISLINAFNFLENNLKERPEYFERFYSSFNKIKLSFLVTNYPDAVRVNRDTILGSWERAFNFPNNQAIRDSTLQYNFKRNTFTNKQAQEFTYKLRNDSIFFYFNSNLKKPISSFKAQYSEEFETLIFENVPIDQGKFQTQYYRRVK
jgi:tetratricopeptide (TPR) repeat protein